MNPGGLKQTNPPELREKTRSIWRSELVRSRDGFESETVGVELLLTAGGVVSQIIHTHTHTRSQGRKSLHSLLFLSNRITSAFQILNSDWPASDL